MSRHVLIDHRLVGPFADDRRTHCQPAAGQRRSEYSTSSRVANVRADAPRMIGLQARMAKTIRPTQVSAGRAGNRTGVIDGNGGRKRQTECQNGGDGSDRDPPTRQHQIHPTGQEQSQAGTDRGKNWLKCSMWFEEQRRWSDKPYRGPYEVYNTRRVKKC